MDSYPSLPIMHGSTLEDLDGIETKRADNGALKVWSTWPASRIGKIVLKHMGISQAERDALSAFYAAHRGATIQLTSRLTNYVAVNCRMTAPPQIVPSQIPGCWDATCNLVGA